jgi:hypothetical protein
MTGGALSCSPGPCVVVTTIFRSVAASTRARTLAKSLTPGDKPFWARQKPRDSVTGALLMMRASTRRAYAWADSAPRALNFAIRRDLRRAALLRWMMPLPAVRSSMPTAVTTAVWAAF